MRILVTGGCGFIGVNLIAYLLENTDADVTVLDNLSLGRREHLDEFNVEFIEGDITDARLVGTALEGMDAVVHLAADTRVMDSIENPDLNFEVNVMGTYNLLAASRRQGVERFIFASTGGAIIGDVVPPVHEEMMPRPISPYGASKLCGEAYCSAFAGSYGMKTVSLRFSNVYGPRSYHKGSVVAHFFKQILAGQELVVYGDGEQTRDFVFVDDLCKAIHRSLEVDGGGLVFQLGTGMPTSVNDLVDEMRLCVGKSLPVQVRCKPARRGEILRNYADISHACEHLGYAPVVSLEEGLERTWRWFKSQSQ